MDQTTQQNAYMLNQSLNDLTNNLWNAYNAHNSEKDSAWSKDFSEQQFEWQKQWAEKQFEYQEYLNRFTANREDTAIQRRAADLAAAGLNPNLAVGQSASSQGFSGGGSAGVVGSSLPSRFHGKFSNGLLDSQVRLAQLGQMQSQNELLDAQQRYYDALSGKVTAETTNISSSKANLEAQTERLLYDLDESRKRHIRTTDSNNYALIQQLIGTIESAYKSHGENLNRVLDTIKSMIPNVPDFSNFVDDLVRNSDDEHRSYNEILDDGQDPFWEFAKKKYGASWQNFKNGIKILLGK